jgi:hypothetical protein
VGAEPSRSEKSDQWVACGTLTQGQSGSSDKLYLYGEPALKWRLEAERKYPGSVSTVYALVEKNRLIGLGARQRKADDGYTYSW